MAYKSPKLNRLVDTMAFVADFVDHDLAQMDWDISFSANVWGHSISKLVKGTDVELIPVFSCFGPFAIYKMKWLGRCEYTSYTCEHVGFNGCIAKNGGRNFLNPYMPGFYNNEPDSVTCTCFKPPLK